jgi:hypothetical protein
MLKNILSVLFILSLFTQMSCELMATPGQSEETGGGNAIEVNTEAADDETGVDPGSIEVDTENSPAGFVPLPSNDQQLAIATNTSATDTSLNVIGADHQLASLMENVTELVKNYAPNLYELGVNTLNQVTPKAYAVYDSADCPLDADDPDSTCIYINEDGSYDATELANGAVTQASGGFESDYILIATVEDTGTILTTQYYDPSEDEYGEEATDTIYDSATYTAVSLASANAVTSDGTNLYQVDGEGNFIQITMNSDGTVYTGSGSFDDEYNHGSLGESVTGLLYDSNYGVYIVNKGDSAAAKVLNSDGTISEGDESGAMTSTDPCFSGGSSTECSTDYIGIPTGCSVNSQKLRGDKVYMTAGCDAGQNYGYLYEFYDNTSSEIEYSDRSATYDSESGIYAQTVKAFDVQYNTTVSLPIENLVVFEDSDGYTRLFASAILLTSTVQVLDIDDNNISGVKDIIITESQDLQGATPGKAIMLHDGGVSNITYSLITCSASDCSDAVDPGITIDSTIGINNGFSIVTDSTKPDDMTHAFVLSNDNDDTSAAGDFVTVIDLSNSALDASTYTDFYDNDDGIIYLSTLFGEKDLTDIDPKAIYFSDIDSNEALYIYSTTLKSGIVIDL